MCISLNITNYSHQFTYTVKGFKFYFKHTVTLSSMFLVNSTEESELKHDLGTASLGQVSASTPGYKEKNERTTLYAKNNRHKNV